MRSVNSRVVRLLVSVLLLAPAGITRAGTADGPTVVELFTSQGCSSCPPADALLGELAQRPDVLALALHITYWDGLGWRDRYAQERFDARQRDYVDRLRLRSTYTPQLVVNGMVDVVGSQRDAVKRAIAGAVHPAAILLNATDAGLAVEMPALAARCNCVLTLFAIQSVADTRVGAGENGGHTLREFQLVRVQRSLGRWKGEARSLVAKLDGMPKEVDGYAVLAQEGAGGRIVAAGRLRNP